MCLNTFWNRLKKNLNVQIFGKRGTPSEKSKTGIKLSSGLFYISCYLTLHLCINEIFFAFHRDIMGKLKRKKLANALGRMLSKTEKKQVQERKANAYTENIEKAKKNQVKPKNFSDTIRVRPQYNSKDVILLIGEGNFSFARSLCENYLEEGAENLTATCYDTENVLYEKYGDEAKDNVALVQEYGGTVLFEVDATNMPKDLKKNRYTKIVFNFPHAGKCQILLFHQLFLVTNEYI